MIYDRKVNIFPVVFYQEKQPAQRIVSIGLCILQH